MQKIKDLKDLSKEEHEHYIKDKCPSVRSVYCSGIYFKNENDPYCCGMNISFHSYPKPLSRAQQAHFIKIINCACNTEFVLED